jgi:hypothetical protein
MGSLALSEGFPLRHNGAIDELAAAFDFVVRYYRSRTRVDAVESMRQGSVIPLNKHKGYPDHTSNYYKEAVSCHLSITAAILAKETTLAEVMAEMEDLTGLPQYQTQFVRLSGSRKWIGEMRWKDGWLQPSEERLGYWARSRTVMGQSMFINALPRRYVGIMKDILLSQPQHALEPGKLMQRAIEMWALAQRMGTTPNSLDIKSFDTSCSHAWLQLLQDRTIVFLKQEYGQYADALGIGGPLEEILEQYLRAGLLGPAVSQGLSAFLYEVLSGLGSGRADTSVIGTYSSVSRLWAWARQASGKSFTWLAANLGVVWDYLSWGDDLVVVVPPDWSITTESYGWQLEGVPDILLFLSKVWGPGKTSHALVSRMYINTINKEVKNEPKHEIVAILGYRARKELLRGHPLGWLYDEAMNARPQTARIVEVSTRLSDEEVDKQLLAMIAENKLSAVAMEALEQDMVEAGYNRVRITDAIAEALGRTHAFGVWTDEDITKPISESIKTLTELGKEAP